MGYHHVRRVNSGSHRNHKYLAIYIRMHVCSCRIINNISAHISQILILVGSIVFNLIVKQNIRVEIMNYSKLHMYEELNLDLNLTQCLQRKYAWICLSLPSIFVSLKHFRVVIHMVVFIIYSCVYYGK